MLEDFLFNHELCFYITQNVFEITFKEGFFFCCTDGDSSYIPTYIPEECQTYCILFWSHFFFSLKRKQRIKYVIYKTFRLKGNIFQLNNVCFHKFHVMKEIIVNSLFVYMGEMLSMFLWVFFLRIYFYFLKIYLCAHTHTKCQQKRK